MVTCLNWHQNSLKFCWKTFVIYGLSREMSSNHESAAYYWLDFIRMATLPVFQAYFEVVLGFCSCIEYAFMNGLRTEVDCLSITWYHWRCTVFPKPCPLYFYIRSVSYEYWLYIYKYRHRQVGTMTVLVMRVMMKVLLRTISTVPAATVPRLWMPGTKIWEVAV